MVIRRLDSPQGRARSATDQPGGPTRQGRPTRHGRVISVLAALAVGVAPIVGMASVVAVAAAGQAAAQVVWVEPVVAPVVDGFRPPSHIGAPGNRGWEYITDPGTVVVAAGDGVVVFAGPIGGSNYISIQHPDGRRTTYSHVDTVTVRPGDAVGAGAPIATSGERLHFGVRVGDEYRDPGELFGAASGGIGGVDGGLRLLPASERSAVPRSRSTGAFEPDRFTVPPIEHASHIDTSPTSTLGRWMASTELPRVGTAGS
jgi:murein DD-endopeptidase MepM/ murein hydrolase activator NlpD